MSSNVQSVIFERSKWSVEDAKSYCRKHGFKYFAPHITDRYIRFRQYEPSGRYLTKEVARGVKYIIPVGEKSSTLDDDSATPTNAMPAPGSVEAINPAEGEGGD